MGDDDDKEKKDETEDTSKKEQGNTAREPTTRVNKKGQPKAPAAKAKAKVTASKVEAKVKPAPRKALKVSAAEKAQAKAKAKAVAKAKTKSAAKPTEKVQNAKKRPAAATVAPKGKALAPAQAAVNWAQFNSPKKRKKTDDDEEVEEEGGEEEEPTEDEHAPGFYGKQPSQSHTNMKCFFQTNMFQCSKTTFELDQKTFKELSKDFQGILAPLSNNSHTTLTHIQTCKYMGKKYHEK